MCGGTAAGTGPPHWAGGLSPRVRGNRGYGGADSGMRGSIPACAGEPSPACCTKMAKTVYPRVCGGTRAGRNWAGFRRGLSPRVRGNHPVYAMSMGGVRSIPACAGEPRTSTGPAPGLPVYPRVCGGTRHHAVGAGNTVGLSPRVRGNRRAPASAVPGRRSIPACAGEPAIGGLVSISIEVYPRVCGGTVTIMPAWYTACGLSPRVRGNPERPAQRAQKRRSIPACAGEPFCPIRRRRSRGVYPRVCGGTTLLRIL